MYTYNPVGHRLTRAECTDARPCLSTAYSYDDHDRRLTETGYASTHDHNGNLLTKTGNGEPWQLTYNAMISSTIDGTMPRYYHADGMGSVSGLSDLSGAMTDRYTYDAYGLLSGSSGTTPNPSRYRGEPYDADLNAYYLRARYYQPGTGRFLTADPLEGVPNAPMSQHRYLYGTTNPVNTIDPSGRIGVLDTLVTGAILADLSVIALHSSGALDSTYEKFGDWLPDAATYGFSGTLNMAKIIQQFMDMAGIGNAPWYYPMNTIGASGGVTVGVEVLYSISSAQIGTFWYYGLQAEFTQLPYMNKRQTLPNKLPHKPSSSYGSASIYRGWVWNLWNAENYSGPFMSLSIGPFMMFCDGKNYFDGPYGVGYNILGNSSIASLSLTSYRNVIQKPWNYEHEWEIIPRLFVAQAAFALIHTLLAQEYPWGPVLVFSIESSMNFIIADAKKIWNRANDSSVKKRQ